MGFETYKTYDMIQPHLRNSLRKSYLVHVYATWLCS